MDFGFLAFLAEPWFVIPWLILAAAAAVWLNRAGADTAWPALALLFPLLAPALRRRALDASAFGQAAARGIAGLGLGVLAAMVVARLAGLGFWQEFWFEFAAGYLCALLLIRPGAGYRAEGRWRRAWVAPLAVAAMMTGVGVVTGLVMPLVVGEQPSPARYAFWGFAELGLLAGAGLVLLMHGMLDMRRFRPSVRVLAAILLALAGLVSVDRSVAYREGLPVEAISVPVPQEDPTQLQTMIDGARLSADAAADQLAAGKRSKAVHALDAALRSAEVTRHAAPGEMRRALDAALTSLMSARRRIQSGSPEQALPLLSQALVALDRAVGRMDLAAPPAVQRLGSYKGARVIDAEGVHIGEVVDVRVVTQRGPQVVLRIGGVRDALGFVSFGGRELALPADRVVFGAPRYLRPTLVAAPAPKQAAGTVVAQEGTGRR